jgi:hypothetical protein
MYLRKVCAVAGRGRSGKKPGKSAMEKRKIEGECRETLEVGEDR